MIFALTICAIIVGFIALGSVWLALAAEAIDDPWDECSDLQGSPRTAGARLPPAEILQIHDGDHNR